MVTRIEVHQKSSLHFNPKEEKDLETESSTQNKNFRERGGGV